MLPRTAGTRKKRLHEGVEQVIATTLQEQWLVLGADARSQVAEYASGVKRPVWLRPST
ncbi:hypothetical protein [Mesorhizobium sp.]|uniref:hypothetical protein n=1 Tax=Mesorhizobium sp. TaxID=1871066 RepID=UPI00338DD058